MKRYIISGIVFEQLDPPRYLPPKIVEAWNEVDADWRYLEFVEDLVNNYAYLIETKVAEVIT